MARRTYSKNQATAFKQMAKRFRVREENISVVDSRIAKYQADELKRWMELNYDAFVARDDPKGVQDHDGTFTITKDSYNRFRVIASGKQILYDEFGTGERGKSHPHTEKSRYSLMPYNSGETIRIDKNGNHYWYWNGFRTYGVPAGMFIFDSINVMANGVAREIAMREINKENKKLLHL